MQDETGHAEEASRISMEATAIMASRKELQQVCYMLAQSDQASVERDLAEAMQRQAPQKDLANALKQYIGALEWLREEHYRQASAEVASHIRDGDFVAAENAWNRAEKYGHDLVQQEVEGLRARAAEMVRPHVEPGASAEEPEQTAPGGP